MSQHLCKYAVVRFLPYRETEEFVNVGVVILCEALGFLGHALERRRVTRVTDFFNELDADVYRHGVKELEREMKRLGSKTKVKMDDRLSLEGGAPGLAAAFEFLVRPRRTIFSFSSVRVMMCPDPVAKVDELFAHYVKRQFAQRKEYQEKLMKKSIQEHLKDWNLSPLYREKELSTSTYRMPFPFVHEGPADEARAISALHLNYDDTTEILRRGDQIVGGLRRLRAGGALPGECLFVVKTPDEEGPLSDAAQEVVSQVKDLHIKTAPADDVEELRAFASLALPEGILIQEEARETLKVRWG